MGKRTLLPYVSTGTIDPATVYDHIENLREGTRTQFESAWVKVPDGTAKTFPHGLNEIPWLVDVVGSTTEDGKVVSDRNSDVTVVKDGTNVTVTNNAGEDLYFKVRAM